MKCLRYIHSARHMFDEIYERGADTFSVKWTLSVDGIAPSISTKSRLVSKIQAYVSKLVSDVESLYYTLDCKSKQTSKQHMNIILKEENRGQQLIELIYHVLNITLSQQPLFISYHPKVTIA